MLILILYFTHSVNLYKKKPSTNIWLYLLRFFYIENVKEPCFVNGFLSYLVMIIPCLSELRK